MIRNAYLGGHGRGHIAVDGLVVNINRYRQYAVLLNGIQRIHHIRLGIPIAEMRLPRSVSLKADGVRLIHDIGFSAAVAALTAVQRISDATGIDYALGLDIPGVQTSRPACALRAFSNASGSFLPRFAARFRIPRQAFAERLYLGSGFRSRI